MRGELLPEKLGLLSDVQRACRDREVPANGVLELLVLWSSVSWPVQVKCTGCAARLLVAGA